MGNEHISNGSEKRVKIEDIMNYMPDNWVVYEKLITDDFVPFIGAGLSAGIGIGNWDELIYAVANEFFNKKYNDNSDIKNIDIVLEANDEKIINECFEALDDLDKEEKKDLKQIQHYVKLRIQVIEKFINRIKEAGKKKVDLQYRMFQNLMGSKRQYAAYEAAELLDQIDNRRGSVYEILKYEINKKRPEGGRWKVDINKAVYWIPLIINKKNLKSVRYNCITTNFDSIIEDVCLYDKLNVGYLHGNIDYDERKICFTLTDLVNNYKFLLNENITDNISGVVRDVNGGNFKRVFYLFLGTSFSEGHIGRIMESLESGKENYAIIATEKKPDRNELYEIQERVRGFGIGEHNILFYQIRNEKHDELVDLLHQLSRDVSKGFWNNWDMLSELNITYKSSPSETHLSKASERAINWLEKMDEELLRSLTIKISETENFEDEFIEDLEGHSSTLICSGNQYLFNQAIKERFKRPTWSVCFLPFQFDDFSDSFWQKELVPLGNTLYFIIEAEGLDDEGKVYRELFNRLKIETEEGAYKFLNCRIIRVVFKLGLRDILYAIIEKMYLKSNNNERAMLSACMKEISLEKNYEMFVAVLQEIMDQNVNTINKKNIIQNEIQDEEKKQRQLLNDRKDNL